MTETHLQHFEETQPLIAVVCTVPLIGEAVLSALEFADVRVFQSGTPDIGGLFRSLRPDGMVVDSGAAAREAADFALDEDRPLIHIGIRDRTLRLLMNGAWRTLAIGGDPSAEAVRNVLIGALYARTERV